MHPDDRKAYGGVSRMLSGFSHGQGYALLTASAACGPGASICVRSVHDALVSQRQAILVYGVRVSCPPRVWVQVRV